MNMAVQSENERNKAVVDEYFKAGVLEIKHGLGR
jgi:hypothetical protein